MLAAHLRLLLHPRLPTQDFPNLYHNYFVTEEECSIVLFRVSMQRTCITDAIQMKLPYSIPSLLAHFV